MCDSKKKSSYEHGSDFERLPRYLGKRSTLQRVHKCIDVGGDIFENLLWDVPDADEPGFFTLQIISNTMVCTSMHVMLVVMLFIT